jgi:hypothetical protein
LVYDDDVNILGGSMYSIRKYTDTLVTTIKDKGLEVRGDKTKYMVISQDQNAGQSHKIKTSNNCFERVKQFKYLRTILTNQILFRKTLRARESQGLLESFGAKFCFPVRYPKI